LSHSRQRIVVVTGGAGGIGLAIVRRFVADGDRVAFVAQNAGRIEKALHSIGPADGRVIGQSIDVTDGAAAAGFVAEIQARWGAVDVLVNNAGISPRRSDGQRPWLLQTSLEEWRRVLDVNITGSFIFAKLVAPGMIAQRYGRIVNIGSLAGRTVPLIAGPHYAASKAGLVGFTRAAARDLAPHGITVNCVAPGRILTGMTEPLESEANRAALARIPVGRIGRPEEIADAVAFLASEAAAFVTATTIDVNGGEFGS
jgi:3-oxoacyl-[acyl-carrier protein] reductase